MLAVTVMLLGLMGIAQAQDFTKPAAITIVNVQGQARYSIDGKNWHPLVVGKILHSGAVIETANGSTADLVISGTPVPVPQTSASPQSLPLITMAPDRTCAVIWRTSRWPNKTLFACPLGQCWQLTS